MASETYTVEASLQWKTNVPEVLRQLQRGFEDVDKLIRGTQTSLGKFAADLRELSTGGKGINALARAMEKLKIPSTALDSLRDVARLSNDIADAQATMAREVQQSARAFREMAEASRAIRMPGTLGAGGSGRHGGGSHGTMLDAAMGASMVGDAGTGYFERSISAAAHVNHTLAVISADQRVTAAQQAAVQALAQQTVRAVPGSTVGGNLEIFNDLKNTFGDINEAMEHLGTFSKLVTSLQIMDMSHGGEGNLRQALNTAKFIEDQGGAIDPNNPTRYDGRRFEEIAAKIIAVDVATGGRVDPAAMLAFQKQARTGGMMMSDHALYGETPYFANAFGASKLGTALFSDVQVMLGGRLMKEHEQELEYYGAIAKGSGHYVKEKGPNGKPKYEWAYDPRSMGQAGLLASDPYAWIHDFLAPKVIAKEHLDVTKKPDLDRLLLVLTQIAQRGTQAGLWADAYRGYGPAQKEAANIAAQNPDMLKHFMATDPTAQIMQFHAAENELMVTIGQAVMGPAIESLKALTNVLRGMSDWGKNNPAAAKNILAVAGGLAVLSKVAGDTAMAALFIGGPLITGVRALGLAVAPFAPGGAAALALASMAALVGALAWSSGTETQADKMEQEGHHFRVQRPDAYLYRKEPSASPQITNKIYLNGKEVAKALLGNSTTQSGMTGHDGSMSLFPSGLPSGAGN